MTTYILNEPGPMVTGSHGESEYEFGPLIWTARKDAETITLPDGVSIKDLVGALATMATTLGDAWTASSTGGAFTCMEAEALADVLNAAGHEAEAAAWLAGHAEGDDDPEDMHYKAEVPAPETDLTAVEVDGTIVAFTSRFDLTEETP